MYDEEWGHGHSRFYRRPTFWWVVLTAICACAMFLENSFSGFLDKIIVLQFSSCASLFASIGFWLAVGTRWWRIPVQFVSWLVVAHLLTRVHGRLAELFLSCFFGLLVIGVVALPIFLFRQLKNGTLAKRSRHKAAVKELLQFSVFHLLSLMTGVAVLIPVGQWLFSVSDDGSIFRICALSVALSLGPLVAVWATLGNHPGIRTIVASLAIAAIAGLNFILSEWRLVGWYWKFYSVPAIIVWLQITALMWCVRWEGFRFITRPRTH